MPKARAQHALLLPHKLVTQVLDAAVRVCVRVCNCMCGTCTAGSGARTVLATERELQSLEEAFFDLPRSAPLSAAAAVIDSLRKKMAAIKVHLHCMHSVN